MLGQQILTDDEKYKIEDSLKNIEDLDWEFGQYTFVDFIDYFQLPQVTKVEQVWNSNLISGQFLFLHSIFDRYVIVGNPLDDPGNKYIFSDWFKGECRVISTNPILKKRWWVFQGAFELYRFELPREIKVLSEMPVHMRVSDDPTKPWMKVVLKRNSWLSAIRKQQYQTKDANKETLAEPKEGFILADSKGNEYIMPPGVPFRFATRILDHELHDEYRNHDGLFSIPEVLMRYEFPVDVEIINQNDKDPKPRIFRLETFCVTKSVIAVIFGKHMDSGIIELSPESQFTLHCPKCLTYGLPQANIDESETKIDESEVQRYDLIRTSLSNILSPSIELFKQQMRVGSTDEIECIEKAHEISMQLENEQQLNTEECVYMTMEDAINFVKNEKDVIPFSKAHPKTFTVHACIDPGNPYNEAIDYELMETEETDSDNSKGTEENATRIREAIIMQSEDCDPIPRDSFEKTVRAIPNELYVCL